ncbi:MAG: hypothetical protein Q8S84_06755 [bacterium]|nr:hypothetical protein [bacterium]
MFKSHITAITQFTSPYKVAYQVIISSLFQLLVYGPYFGAIFESLDHLDLAYIFSISKLVGSSHVKSL